MQIAIRVVREYGNDRRYLVDKTQADAFEVLTGRKTLRDSDVWALEAFGHHVVDADEQQ